MSLVGGFFRRRDAETQRRPLTGFRLCVEVLTYESVPSWCSSQGLEFSPPRRLRSFDAETLSGPLNVFSASPRLCVESC